MKRKLFSVLIATLICGIAINSAFAKTKDDSRYLYDSVVNHLKTKGLSQNEIDPMERSIRSMLKHGVKSQSLVYAIVNLKKKGIKGGDLKNCVNFMNDLIVDGETNRRSIYIVSKAARKARKKGLKDKEFADKVREAVKKNIEKRRELRQKPKK